MDTELKVTLLNALDLHGEVIGGALYVEPSEADAKVLRIELAQAIRSQEYEGLRVKVVHPDNGEIDTTLITFTETNALPDGKSTILGYLSHPLRDIDVSGLRDAITRYASHWFTEPRHNEDD